MAKIANANCKKIYITDDNPRNENPRKIRRQLLKYISKNRAFEVNNRQLAIKKAIQNAEPHELILVAGKGHEEYQIYTKIKYLIFLIRKLLKKSILKIKL